MSNYENLLVSNENGIGYLKINRPKMLNALSFDVLTELNVALDDIAANRDIKVLIVTGEGDKAFVAGADIKEMKDKSVLEGKAFSNLGNNVFEKLANLRQPTIAALNGYTLGGGCELALSCDLRVATTKAKLGQPEVGLGIIPGFGGTQRLSRLIGPARAKDLIFTARIVDSQEALQMGLVNKVVESDVLLEEVEAIAKQIMKQAPLAVERAKEAINVGYDLPLNHGLKYEADLFGSLFSTADQTEGMTAFVDKRRPEFKHQ
ncbi:enoyl-CoA hydratase/isomerase family protein [Aerococcaceae bacterium zg-BR9]|uniref:enoyl-CoA hydratase-related protein n=1 Tax=Aerococcaceae bacterium zg-1292 TaxID=2774330 RepID=UPI004064614A|nr:enoyl-CoA hydratase/isomerase family protein [Aerococcaceae bacterium zg-BR9]